MRTLLAILLLAGCVLRPSTIYVEAESGAQCAGHECGPYGAGRVGVTWDVTEHKVHRPKRQRADAPDGGVEDQP